MNAFWFSTSVLEKMTQIVFFYLIVYPFHKLSKLVRTVSSWLVMKIVENSWWVILIINLKLRFQMTFEIISEIHFTMNAILITKQILNKDELTNIRPETKLIPVLCHCHRAPLLLYVKIVYSVNLFSTMRRKLFYLFPYPL